MRFPCPCCGYVTLAERSSYAICKVCFWEDDGQGDGDADVERGGPNHVSLSAARTNFRAFGAAEQRFVKFVRQPRADEYPPGPSEP